jgi:hypothetical protein
VYTRRGPLVIHKAQQARTRNEAGRVLFNVVLVELQAVAAAPLIAALIRLADAADMPAIRPASRTPLPAANSFFARSTLALAIGGRPKRIDSALAAA